MLQKVKSAVRQQGRRRLAAVIILALAIAIPAGIAWAHSRLHVRSSQTVVLNSQTSAPQAAQINLTAGGLSPQLLVVKKNAPVAWYNQTGKPVQITGLDSAGVSLPPSIGPGQIYSATLSQAGTYHYTIGGHTGTIIVQAG